MAGIQSIQGAGAFDMPARGAIELSRERLASIPGLRRMERITLGLVTRIKWGELTITLPDGRSFHAKGEVAGGHGQLTIHDPAFFRRMMTGGALGFAEAYIDGLCDTPDLTTFLEVFARNNDLIGEELQGKPLYQLIQRLYHLLHRNTRRGSRRNIMAHYDLGNEFYSKWLDETMTYSSAKFEDGAEDLATAQTNKYRSLAERLGLRPGMSVLEIGSGWGGFAEYAAKDRKCEVTGITISQEQLNFARRRMQSNGLDQRAQILFRDYRDVEEKFDRIASIEMFEAVGEAYWPAYFSKIRDCLKPGGLAGLQIITIADKYFESYRRHTDFIQRYVFPGGMLPSLTALKHQVEDAGLEWRDNISFGLDYAKTLAEWRVRFLKAWPEIKPLGFDERFRRLWEYYLSYCEAGFRGGNIDVIQLTLQRN